MQPETTAWISNEVLDLMKAEGDAFAPTEAGGVLMGYWYDESEVVVTDFIDGGPDAEHLTSGFTPDATYQNRRIAEMYEESGRLHTYLGDWHTHPAGGASLSCIDRETARKIARSRDARCHRPLMMLLTDQRQWHAAAWTADRDWLHRIVMTPTTLHTFAG